MSIAERVAAFDVTLFEPVEAQTAIEDQRSLLALHAAAAETGDFEYLEIGSHVGGSLQALVRDPRCTRIVSVDSRPDSQPDGRGHRYAYPGNTTERMLGLLAAIEDADLTKVETIDAETGDIPPASLRAPLIAFIDGEHTDGAALADARWCRAVLGGSPGVIAFHDAWIVHRAIRGFLDELEGEEFGAALLPDSIVAVELGPPRLLRSAAVRSRLDRSVWAYLDGMARQAAHREASAAGGSRLSRVRRRLLRR